MGRLDLSTIPFGEWRGIIIGNVKDCIQEDNFLHSWQFQLCNSENINFLVLSEVYFATDSFQIGLLSNLIQRTLSVLSSFQIFRFVQFQRLNQQHRLYQLMEYWLSIDILEWQQLLVRWLYLILWCFFQVLLFCVRERLEQY